VGDVIHEEDRHRGKEQSPADQLVWLGVIRHKEIVEQLMPEPQRWLLLVDSQQLLSVGSFERSCRESFLTMSTP
jgi:hypothetical protein